MTEEPNAQSAPAAPEPEEAVLVESGELQVDRRQALKVVRDYQVPAAAPPLPLFIRTAVASGASRITVEQGEGHCELRFGGLPFGRGELEFPYAGLFGEAEGASVRARHLAVALLRVLRERPDRVRLASGAGGQRVWLELRGLEDFTTGEADDAPAAQTILRIEWSSGSKERFCLPAEEVSRLCALAPADIFVDGARVVDPRRTLSEPVVFETGGVRGALRVADRHQARAGRLEVFSFGVFACELPWPVAGPPVAGRINDDSLKLNVSLSGVVEDERYARVKDILFEAVKELAPIAAAGQRERLLGLGEILLKDPGLRVLCRRKFVLGAEAPEGETFFDVLFTDPWRLLGAGPRTVNKKTKILRAAYLTLWLRQACDAFRVARDGAPEDPRLRPLREIPLLLNESGLGLSIEDLDKESRGGRILHASEPDFEYPGREVIVWCLEQADLDWLLKRFPEAAPRGKG